MIFSINKQFGIHSLSHPNTQILKLAFIAALIQNNNNYYICMLIGVQIKDVSVRKLVTLNFTEIYRYISITRLYVINLLPLPLCGIQCACCSACMKCNKFLPSNWSTDCAHAELITFWYGCTPHWLLVTGSLLSSVTPSKVMDRHRTRLDGETNCTRNLFFFSY